MGRRVGAYELLRELGRGGQGAVYLARHAPTGSERALKGLEGTLDPESLERFRREALALARAGGAAVTVHEVVSEEGRLYLVLDYCPGGSLRDRLGKTGCLDWREAASLVARIARGLDRCHELGLVHRDLKPENVLFDEQGAPRIADWGLARDLGRSRLTETGTILGTPSYMSFEQIEGKPVDRRADVFALGVILHELVAGTRPFAGRTWYDLGQSIARGQREALATHGAPAGLDRILSGALAARAGARTPSARVLADQLEALVAKGGDEPARARPFVRALGLGVGLLALVGAGAFALGSSEKPGLLAGGTPSPGAPVPAPTHPAAGLSSEAVVEARLKAGTGPVSSRDAPWEVVSRAPSLVELAARRAVVYSVADVRHGSNGARLALGVLEAIAVMTSSDSAARLKGQELLRAATGRGEDDFDLAHKLAEASAVVDRFPPSMVPAVLDPDRLPYTTEPFHRNVRVFSSRLPDVLRFDHAVVEAVLAPLVQGMREDDAAVARSEALAPAEGLGAVDLGTTARHQAILAIFSEDALRKSSEGPRDVDELVAHLPSRLLLALKASRVPLVAERCSLLAEDRDPSVAARLREVAAADPLLAAAALVVELLGEQGRHEENEAVKLSAEQWVASVEGRVPALERLLAEVPDPRDALWRELVRHDLAQLEGRAHRLAASVGRDAQGRLEHRKRAREAFGRATRICPDDTAAEGVARLNRKIRDRDAPWLVEMFLEDGLDIDDSLLGLLGRHPLAGEVLRLRGFPGEAVDVCVGYTDRAHTAERALAFADEKNFDRARDELGTAALAQAADGDETGIPGQSDVGSVRRYVADKEAKR